MSLHDNASLKSLVDLWLQLDKNPATCQEIQALWDGSRIEELEKRMRPRIGFGTSGLRSKMEAGWARMNDLIIIQASQGLCAYVRSNVPDASARGIVIGHDHRHHSDEWAKLTAAVFIAKGFKVYFYNTLVPTPMVPFGVRKLNAACGVMITASHNPKNDNGYKVYWSNGVQIVSPHDKGISASILDHHFPETWSTQNILSSQFCVDCTEKMSDLYFRSLESFCISRSLNSSFPYKIVNTSMHGVSHPWVEKAFRHFGFAPFIAVPEQQEPDPEFPTVRFPNPEEKGAFDLAISTADREGAMYVLAQDPDSDRFSAAERGPSGGWHIFTGDQLGTLFAERIMNVYKSSGRAMNKLAMVSSIVSSKMIEAMAQVEGFKFVGCHSGFKYVGNTALSLAEQGYDVLFGYEEAIGFMFSSDLPDKDGVAATVLFAELAVSLCQDGKTVQSHLKDLYERLSKSPLLILRGLFNFLSDMATSNNGYFLCDDPSVTKKIFARLRNFPGTASQTTDQDFTALNQGSLAPSYPSSIANLNICRVVDMTTGYDSGNPPSFKSNLPSVSGQMIQFRAMSPNDGTSIVLTVRTSGTEPKIKYYLEGKGKNTEVISDLLPRVLQELADKWIEMDRYHLERSA